MFSLQSRNIRVFEPILSTGCGDLCINQASPIQLPQEYAHLKDIYNVPLPEEMEKTTRLQSKSNDWFKARQQRLTASNFGQIINRKSCPTEKMLSRLFSKQTFSAPSLTYGKNNENKGKSKYLSQFPDRHIHECGFVVNNEFPFLGATPDGKLCDNGTVGILEIKCPYSARDKTIIEACSQISDFYLERNEETISLKTSHSYYAQVQGQLMVTGCAFCDFVVFCPNESDLFVQRIGPDLPFMTTMLGALAKFFMTHAHPFLTQTRN